MPGVLTVSPLENPDEYNRITLAGFTTSVEQNGVIEVTGSERLFSWDQKKSAGSQGQTITYRGWGLAKPKLKFKFWTVQQILNFWTQLVPLMYYDAEKTAPKPYDAYHPKLLASEIIWLVTEKIGELEDIGNQLWSVTVETLEYRQAKAKNSTTTPEQANQNNGAGGTKPTVKDDQDREIEELRHLYNQPLPR